MVQNIINKCPKNKQTPRLPLHDGLEKELQKPASMRGGHTLLKKVAEQEDLSLPDVRTPDVRNMRSPVRDSSGSPKLTSGRSSRGGLFQTSKKKGLYIV